MIGNKVLIVYYSLGGNTEVLANRIVDKLKCLGEEVHLLRLDKEVNFTDVLIEYYDFVMLGTPTYGNGNSPKLVLDFLRYFIKDNDFELPSFSVFGTGDTQWGETLFCRAVDESEYHLKKKTSVLNKLKIEQRPMSKYQIEEINKFVELTIRRL